MLNIPHKHQIGNHIHLIFQLIRNSFILRCCLPNESFQMMFSSQVPHTCPCYVIRRWLVVDNRSKDLYELFLAIRNINPLTTTKPTPFFHHTELKSPKKFSQTIADNCLTTAPVHSFLCGYLMHIQPIRCDPSCIFSRHDVTPNAYAVDTI